METADALSSSIHGYLASAKDVCAERLDSVQPFDLHQASQEVRDAVSRRAHSLKELEAFAHSADLVALQPKALGQMPPGLHHSCLAAVRGAQHAAHLLKAVKGKLCGAQAWCWKMEVVNLTLYISERRKQMTWTMGGADLFYGGVGCVFPFESYRLLHCMLWCTDPESFSADSAASALKRKKRRDTNDEISR